MSDEQTDRPAVVIVADPALRPTDWRQLLLGMEEEGIPFVIRRPDGVLPLHAQAYEAAAASPLSVGIAIDARKAVVHEPHLAVDKPLFVMEDYRGLPAEALRGLGGNAARLVKGLPFK
ncbi:glycerol dehydratase reactivase beta/small subunit family protein [Martelella alba]|uniref:Propanediol dehydratase reactivation factor small subunit n=1 Tax=Martelella alba TaxID=2590451 RepID=A0ABY2SUD7_9HYPH|nr:glycerol dehydratase reactivase beta/small subunit family protein [Martelella alba]TKI08049.1 hypothetical protein FCN80_02530 [Martelella alba]